MTRNCLRTLRRRHCHRRRSYSTIEPDRTSSGCEIFHYLYQCARIGNIVHPSRLFSSVEFRSFFVYFTLASYRRACAQLNRSVPLVEIHNESHTSAQRERDLVSHPTLSFVLMGTLSGRINPHVFFSPQLHLLPPPIIKRHLLSFFFLIMISLQISGFIMPKKRREDDR